MSTEVTDHHLQWLEAGLDLLHVLCCEMLEVFHLLRSKLLLDKLLDLCVHSLAKPFLERSHGETATLRSWRGTLTISTVPSTSTTVYVYLVALRRSFSETVIG